jgi:drug/metabolite transporter (DMT)-like permease
MTKQTRAYLCGMGAVLLWSTVATVFKLSLRHLDHVQLLLYANAFAVLFLAVVLGSQRKFGAALACTPREYGGSVLLGVLTPFLYYLILFKAYDLLPAQIAQPLNYTWGIALPLLSIPLLKQRIAAREIVAGLICYTGVVVIATRGNVVDLSVAEPLGVALALGSTIIWALYWIGSTKDERDPVVGLFLAFLFALPFSLLACLVLSDVRVGSVAGLAGAAYVGVVEMGTAFILWLMALRLSANTAKVGNLIFVSPFLSLVFIHLFVGEGILASTILGLILIVAGLLVQGLGRARAAR